MLLKIIGDIGEAVFDGNPNFNSSDAIDIFLPGSKPMLPGFALITDSNVDQLEPDFRNNFQINSSGKVKSRTRHLITATCCKSFCPKNALSG